MEWTCCGSQRVRHHGPLLLRPVTQVPGARQFRQQCPADGTCHGAIARCVPVGPALGLHAGRLGYAAVPGDVDLPAGTCAVLSGGRPITGCAKRGRRALASRSAGRKGRQALFPPAIRGRTPCHPGVRSPAQRLLSRGGLGNPKPGDWNQGADKFRFFGQDIRRWADLKNVEVVVVTPGTRRGCGSPRSIWKTAW